MTQCCHTSYLMESSKRNWKLRAFCDYSKTVPTLYFTVREKPVFQLQASRPSVHICDVILGQRQG